MTKNQRQFIVFLLLIGIVIAYAYIAAAFEEHTILASVIFGVLVVAFVFGLIRFPAFRDFAKDVAKSSVRLFAELFTAEEPARERRKRVPIPRETKMFGMRRAGHRCQIPGCGKRRYLVYHHIDGNRANPDPKNLIVLCRDHHAEADGHAYKPEQLIAWRDKPGS